MTFVHTTPAFTKGQWVFPTNPKTRRKVAGRVIQDPTKIIASDNSFIAIVRVQYSQTSYQVYRADQLRHATLQEIPR